MARTTQTLMRIYDAMSARFGRQGWWPCEGLPAPGGQSGKLEICVGAILTQNTNWRNVEKAIANLRSQGRLSVPALNAMTHQETAELIRPAGYFNVKARRLKNFIAAVARAGGDIEAFLDRPVDLLRADLLAINGIGRETADSIILYAAEKPSFVVDAYTFRIMLRHRLIGLDDDYESVKELFEGNLPLNVELWNDYHAQLVAVGKQYCRPRARCEGCPLEPFDHDGLAGTERYD